MKSRWLRPVSVAVVTLIVGVSIAGFIAGRGFVRSDRNKILRERGSAVAVLLQSVFQQELASIKVLGEVAQVNRHDASKDFTAGAKSLATNGVTVIGLATPSRGHYVVKALVGGSAPVGRPIKGQQAVLIQRGARSFSGATMMMTLGKSRTIGVAIPVNQDVVYLESAIPSTPLSSVAPPFNELRGVLYAAPKVDPTQVVMTTEKHLPLTGDVQQAKFLVGDYEWTLVYASNGPLVGGLTANLPWLLLIVGMFLAVLVAVMFFLQARRHRFAESVVTQRTASLAKANAELDEARVFLRHLVSSGPIVVAVIDADTLDASYVSPNITRLFGLSEPEALTPGLLEEVIEEPHLCDVRAKLNAVAGGSADRFESLEFPVRIHGGESRWVSTVFVSAGSAFDNRSVLVYALDIDEQHRAAAVKEAAQKAADAANRSKSEFLSRMSHELRTPLNAILGYAQLFEMTGPREDQAEPVQQILASGRHLLDMINEVLDISRIESGTLSLSVEPVAVDEVVRTAIDMMRPSADDAGIELRLHPGCDGHIVLADLQRLRQVLLNLVSNAVKYNHLGGTVHVGCETRGGDMIRISVTDDGPGISRDHHELVFAPFERLDADQTEVEGTGMGLALCRRLTEAMGGAIGLDSTVGAGSTFWIELPAAQGAKTPQVVLGEAPLIPDQREPADRTVLLVEDNPANVRLVERIFKLAPGVRVASTTHGRDAVAVAVREHADVVLLDLNLPDMSGERVLATLRSEPRTRDIPVVIVSADATAGQIDRLLAAGAERYLTKPFDVEELLDVVGALAAAR